MVGIVHSYSPNYVNSSSRQAAAPPTAPATKSSEVSPGVALSEQIGELHKGPCSGQFSVNMCPWALSPWLPSYGFLSAPLSTDSSQLPTFSLGCAAWSLQVLSPKMIWVLRRKPWSPTQTWTEILLTQQEVGSAALWKYQLGTLVQGCQGTPGTVCKM